MKLVSESEIVNNAEFIKHSIMKDIVKMEKYMVSEYEMDVAELLKIYFNVAPYNQELIREKSERVMDVLDFFNLEGTLIHKVMNSLELGYVHHIHHLTTGEMAAELGISTQAIHAHLVDIYDPGNVDRAKKNTKKKFIPVKKYPKLILAEKQDFDVFKEWFLNKKQRGSDW